MRSALLLLAALLSPLSGFGAERALDFNRDVRPLLSEHCFACHGFDAKARKAKLRLDLAESALADREGVIAIKPGDLAHSEAWLRITSDDPEEVMPPPKAPHPLKREEKAILKRWIEQGAPYAPHWAFIPPVQGSLPEVANAAWCRNDLDRFILARLEAEGLHPSAEADRRMLIRRVTLDLTGLPPSAEEAAAFAHDSDPQAYEKLVDRLLANPHFGERMALEWLDSARYADTNGFSIDGGRNAWLWRDWVIDSFNRNKPYDAFLREQLAGDLLPNRTEAQLIATGFQRNNMVTHEGGTIPEENLVNYNADRVKTLGEAVLGLTLGCCQCHDHKYDPITQREYYQVFAYFNSASDKGLDGDGGKNASPSLQAKTLLKADDETALQAEITKARARLAEPPAEAVLAWEEEQRQALAQRGEALEMLPVELLRVSAPNKQGAVQIADGRDIVFQKGAGRAPFDIAMRLPKTGKPVTGLRITALPDPATAKSGWGHRVGQGGKGTFFLTGLSASAETLLADQVNIYKLLEFRAVTADSWLEPNRPEGVLNTRTDQGWEPDPAHDGPTHLTATFAQPLRVDETGYLNVQLIFGGTGDNNPARLQLQAMTGSDDGSPLPSEMIALVQMPSAERSPEQQAQVATYFAAHAPAMERIRVEIANLEERLAVLTKPFPTLVMDVSAKPRVTHILNRGDYAQPREEVQPGTPSCLPPLSADAPANRLGLAQWLTMRGHPLTARVAVNRFWQMLFGVGLVKTAADFGAQGEWPSHPELLDYLAVDFMDHGWDVKRTLRQMVLSAAYRQNSATTPELMERDPANRLLARGPRFRLPAEFIRDAALQASGLLVPRLGGPSVNPYTPGDPWREVSHYGSTPATAQTFIQDHGEKLYRRSLYTFWKRTLPPPNMAAFDAPSREICTVLRASTDTPLQSLVLLNDVQFVEAARALAQRILTHPGDDAARLRWAFAETTAREPQGKEGAVLLAALRRERARYTADPQAAAAALRAGEAPRDEQLPAPEHAAWTQVAALLLNLSETITCN